MQKNEFAKDFEEFRRELVGVGVAATVTDSVTLYAIYRKSERVEKFNGNGSTGDEPATDKQKSYLRQLSKDRGFKLTEPEIAKMTRREASKAITTIRGEE